jgi:F-type H+-transporting ATPase subunit a
MSGALLKVFGVGSFAMSIVLSFFEFGVQALQAYIFTLLTSLYIAGSVADEH